MATVQEKAAALRNRSNAGKTEKGPKITAKVSYDEQGNVLITMPQRLSMDMIRYNVNDKGKDVFGICVSLGALEFVAVSEDETGAELETVLVSNNVHLNVNNLQ